MIAGARRLAKVLTWKPLAATTVATSTWLALLDRPSALLLSAAAASVAAATPFVLDDAAEATLQSSTATLRRRRAHRVALTLPLLSAWWVLTFAIVSRATPHLSLAAYTLQFATLLCIGLAGGSTTSTNSDRARRGTIGTLAVIMCFGTAFLPERSLQLIPSDPTAPDVRRQLVVIFALTIAIHVICSCDPARRTTLRRRREWRGLVRRSLSSLGSGS